jgi:hypothetical protein
LKMINAFGFAGITIFKNIDKVGIQNGRWYQGYFKFI